jgi:hypothetical protein
MVMPMNRQPVTRLATGGGKLSSKDGQTADLDDMNAWRPIEGVECDSERGGHW